MDLLLLAVYPLALALLAVFLYGVGRASHGEWRRRPARGRRALAAWMGGGLLAGAAVAVLAEAVL